MFEAAEEQAVRAWAKDQVGQELEGLRLENAKLARTIAETQRETIDSEDQVKMAIIRWGGIDMIAICLAMGTCAGIENLRPAKPEPLSKVEQCSKACNGQMSKWGDVFHDKDGLLNPEQCICKLGEQPIAKGSIPSLKGNASDMEGAFSAPHVEWHNSGGPILNEANPINSRIFFGDSSSFSMHSGQKAELTCRSDGTCTLMETKE